MVRLSPDRRLLVFTRYDLAGGPFVVLRDLTTRQETVLGVGDGGEFETAAAVVWGRNRDGALMRNQELTPIGRGGSDIAAGGGVWAVFNAGDGVRTSRGDHFPLAHTPCVNDAGDVFMGTRGDNAADYRASHNGTAVCRLRTGVGVEMRGGDGEAWRAISPEPACGWAKPEWDGARVVVSMGTRDGMMFVLDTSTGKAAPFTERGFAGGPNYQTDIVAIAPGRWLVAYATPTGAETVGLSLANMREFPRAGTTPSTPPVPPTPPTPKPPEKPAVSIPNHSDTVRAVTSAHPHLLAQNTKDTMTELLWRAAVALHQRDPNWGLLSKSAGENHTLIAGQRVAVDALAYGDSDQIVDIFRAAHDGPGSGGLTWGLDERRPSNVRVTPPPFTGGEQPGGGEPDPEPEPGVPSSDVLERLLAGQLQLVAVVQGIGTAVVANTEALARVAAQLGRGGEVGPLVEQIGAVRQDLHMVATIINDRSAELKAHRFKVQVSF